MTPHACSVQLHDVTRTYRVGDATITALDHVDLEIASGEIVALIGPSGSGKTTLCSIIGGLLTPTGGTVQVAGQELTDVTADDLNRFRREHIGFVFQQVNLVPFLTARENLLVVDRLGRRHPDAHRRADVLLDELGLADRADNLPAQLSGGQRQRVAIGRALMNEPDVVLFDEPTSALDSHIGEQVMQLIHTEMRRRATTAIIVTHDHRTTRFADRTIAIDDGRLAA